MDRKKIMVIEDDEDIAKLVRSNLEMRGFEVTAAFDGMQGTQLAHNLRPDLIILDLMMPAGGGLAVLRNLKRSSKTWGIPVVIYSALTDDARRQEAIENGADVYFDKSRSIAELADYIENRLGGSAGHPAKGPFE